MVEGAKQPKDRHLSSKSLLKSQLKFAWASENLYHVSKFFQQHLFPPELTILSKLKDLVAMH